MGRAGSKRPSHLGRQAQPADHGIPFGALLGVLSRQFHGRHRRVFFFRGGGRACGARRKVGLGLAPWMQRCRRPGSGTAQVTSSGSLVDNLAGRMDEL